jgi:hypothetical protein
MSHHSLNYPRGNTSGVGQRGALAAQRVEVKNLIRCVSVGDAGGGQVNAEHLRSLLDR